MKTNFMPYSKKELGIFTTGDPNNVCRISNLERYMPKVLRKYYDATLSKADRGERQEPGLVEKLLHDESAYQEFLRCVLTHITGLGVLNKMNGEKDTYADSVTVSDEAFGLLLLEDRSLLWREVASLRTAAPHFNGNKSLGVKREMKITDAYGDFLTLYSNGGLLSKAVKKGWSTAGVNRYNELFDVIKQFRDTPKGEEAMTKQKELWKQDSRAVRKRYKRTVNSNKERAEGRGAGNIAIRCEGWDV